MDNKSVDNEFLVASGDINVSEIMNGIKKKIQEKKNSGVLKQKEIDEIEDMELLPLPDFLDIPNAYQPHLYPETQNKADKPKEIIKNEFSPIHFSEEVESGFIKKILGKIRKILFPLIRFMTRPVYNELKNLTIDLHNSNKKSNNDLSNELISITTAYSKIFSETLPTVSNSKEYIKLLHNTLNNMIVESSKLKIEKELLKTRIKVLEDKLEFLENRERALEKKVYN